MGEIKWSRMFPNFLALYFNISHYDRAENGENWKEIDFNKNKSLVEYASQIQKQNSTILNENCNENIESNRVELYGCE